MRLAAPVPLSRPEPVVTDAFDPFGEQQQILARQQLRLHLLRGTFVLDPRHQHEVALEVAVEAVECGDRSFVFTLNAVEDRDHPVVSLEIFGGQEAAGPELARAEAGKILAGNDLRRIGGDALPGP